MAVRGNPVAWQNFYKTARWRRLRKYNRSQPPVQPRTLISDHCTVGQRAIAAR